MKMKNTAFALLAMVAGMASAQVTENAQASGEEKTLVERIAKIEKKHDWFNLYLNINTAFKFCIDCSLS